MSDTKTDYNGRAGGLTAKELEVGVFNPSYDKKKGGSHAQITHRKNGTGFFNPNVAAWGSHKRWHLNKNIVSPKCALCMTGIESWAEIK